MEVQGDSLDPSKVRFVNGGTRKRTGQRRGSVRARTRMALTCETLLALGRGDESPLGHRVSAWALRMPVHRAIAGIDRNARIGRECGELFRDSDGARLWKEYTSAVYTG